VSLRIFEPADGEAPPVEAPPAYRPMVQIAFAWLLAGASLDVYWRLRELDGGFTPMYAAGAIRHAFLLGFATSLIMAMAYRVVPVFSGRALRWPSLVPASFGIVGMAAVLRVVPVAFNINPSDLDFKLLTAGGVLLFVGLSLFAAELASAMFARFAAPVAVAPAHADREPASSAVREAEQVAARAGIERAPEGGPTPEPAPSEGPVHAGMTVAEALRLGPVVLQVLLDFGFGPLADPEMRQRMAPTITIARAAAFVGSTPESLVSTLNAAVAADPARRGDGLAPIDISMSDTDVTADSLLGALRTVYDPEIPVNIVDLGLVYGIKARDAYVHLTMSLTAPGCPAADQVEMDARAALEGVSGIETVDIDMVDQPAWTPERMSRAARAALGWG
jgi:metal-sulfur cluster biosynthetic enzyme